MNFYDDTNAVPINGYIAKVKEHVSEKAFNTMSFHEDWVLEYQHTPYILKFLAQRDIGANQLKSFDLGPSEAHKRYGSPAMAITLNNTPIIVFDESSNLGQLEILIKKDTVDQDDYLRMSQNITEDPRDYFNISQIIYEHLMLSKI